MKTLHHILLPSFLLASLLLPLSTLSDPVVTDVVARQRYPWNGMVDITCTVSGIVEGTGESWMFTVAAVDPDSGDATAVPHVQVIRDGALSYIRKVETNGNYRIVWDARADLGQVRCSNMVVRVTLEKEKHHGKVQLWEGGPYWAETNIGAEAPEEYGFYFWWGDTVGYRRVGDAWVASDGSSQNFSFSEGNTPTNDKSPSTLQSEGWTTSAGVLAPEHDAAHVHWGGNWRMPTDQELNDLCYNCGWTWTTTNGVDGYVVRGRDAFAGASIFLPAAGYGDGTFLSDAGSNGDYWSSVPHSDVSGYSWFLGSYSGYHDVFNYGYRGGGQPVRPVLKFIE